MCSNECKSRDSWVANHEPFYNTYIFETFNNLILPHPNFALFGCPNEVKLVQIALFYLILPHANFAFLAAQMR